MSPTGTDAPTATVVERLPVEDVLLRWQPGSHDWTWQEEFADLLRTDHRALAALLEDVNVRGVLAPVLLGDDGRVWDGHHRLLVARLLDLAEVPVEYGYGSDPAELLITIRPAAPPTPVGPPATLSAALTVELEVPEEDLPELSTAADWPATVARHHGHTVLGRYNAVTGWRHVWCETCDHGLWDCHLSLPEPRRG